MLATLFAGGWIHPHPGEVRGKKRAPCPSCFYFLWPPALVLLTLSPLPSLALPHTRSSAKDLYKKFDELLELTSAPVNAGDRVTGRVTG